MDYHIIKISRNKKQYLDLLLLGDEQETMIDRYLERGVPEDCHRFWRTEACLHGAGAYKNRWMIVIS